MGCASMSASIIPKINTTIPQTCFHKQQTMNKSLRKFSSATHQEQEGSQYVSPSKARNEHQTTHRQANQRIGKKYGQWPQNLGVHDGHTMIPEECNKSCVDHDLSEQNFKKKHRGNFTKKMHSYSDDAESVLDAFEPRAVSKLESLNLFFELDDLSSQF